MTLEEIRNRKIQVVINSIKQAKDQGISVDYEKLIQEVCLRFGASRRTSMDYVDLAMKHTGTKLVKLRNEKQIIHPVESYDEEFVSYQWTYLPEEEIKPYSEPKNDLQ